MKEKLILIVNDLNKLHGFKEQKDCYDLYGLNNGLVKIRVSKRTKRVSLNQPSLREIIVLMTMYNEGNISIVERTSRIECLTNVELIQLNAELKKENEALKKQLEEVL